MKCAAFVFLVACLCAGGLVVGLSFPPVPSGTWEEVGSLVEARSNAASVLLPGGSVIVTGGVGGEGSIPASAEWLTAGGGFMAIESMGTARANHTATVLDDGRVLVAGGWTTDGTASATAEVYDPDAGTWTPVGALSQARADHTATLLNDGRVLVSGGTTDVLVLGSLEIYNPGDDTFSPAGSMTPRTKHAAALLGDGRAPGLSTTMTRLITS